jgi:hypothetical protein
VKVLVALGLKLEYDLLMEKQMHPSFYVSKISNEVVYVPQQSVAPAQLVTEAGLTARQRAIKRMARECMMKQREESRKKR